MAKILIVEDDRDLNRTVCSFLSRCGYDVFGCIDVNEAYDVMYENTIDLIVSDIMMPGTDGFEFAGIIIAGIAYPVFSYITKRQRKKIAPVILKLTDEIADK